MEAFFVRACSTPGDLPLPTLPEIAVAGRSNCGKSSLINALTGQARLARTSSTPGRTRQIVYFQLTLTRDRPFYLVDLPGYGYARAPRSMQRSWSDLVSGYIESRSSLRALLLLNDARRHPADEERDLLAWAAQRRLGTLVLLTKADKLAKHQRPTVAASARQSLGLPGLPLLFSIRDRQSTATLRDQLGLLSQDG